MNIKELKEFIKDLPDDMPVGLLDLTTDSTDDANYPIYKENLLIEDCYNSDEELAGKMLFITFENNLNENPI